VAEGNQIERQWQVLRILENFHFGISVSDLGDRLVCSRRTIERDLKTLRKTGFPITCQKTDDGRKLWRLNKNFTESNQLILDPTELVSIHIARQQMKPVSKTCIGEGFENFWTKIRTLLPKTALNYFSNLDECFYAKTFNAEGRSADNKILELIQEAIRKNKVVKIKYEFRQPDGVYGTEFHPYGLILYEGAFYLTGFSQWSQAIRTFKLQRVKDVALTSKSFKRPADFSLENCLNRSFGIFQDEMEPTTVRCEFRDWAARLMREQKWHRTQVIEKDEGNKLIVSFLLTSKTDFKRWILGFGPFAKVLEPKQLSSEIADSLRKALKNYNKK
jgi:predicted DNA-binding transcriptional regulator YafY